MADITSRRNSYTFDEDESYTEGGDDQNNNRTDLTKNSQGFFEMVYFDNLRKHPLKTKAITCALVSSLGAALGNFYSTDPRLKHKKPETTTAQKTSEIIAFAFYGGAIGGPLTHYWDQWLEDRGAIKVESRQKKSWNMLLDQLIAQPPLLFLMHLMLDMTGAAIRELPKSWNRSLARTADTAVLSWRFWPVALYLM